MCLHLATDVDTAGQSRRDTKSQSIVSIDMHDWKVSTTVEISFQFTYSFTLVHVYTQKAIDKFNISTAAIPHNTSS